ncbi:hypothetical protein [Janthinobacterium sp. B9-8]|uniref:hypothetical protein n=1 Tax=Janthinobacterium sp. B9-8 TaxID=1236179 RepID=UPI0012E3BAB4|nr:hypothetical protein [Janthinobacterium sp. B9-8]
MTQLEARIYQLIKKKPFEAHPKHTLTTKTDAALRTVTRALSTLIAIGAISRAKFIRGAYVFNPRGIGVKTKAMLKQRLKQAEYNYAAASNKIAPAPHTEHLADDTKVLRSEFT